MRYSFSAINSKANISMWFPALWGKFIITTTVMQVQYYETTVDIGKREKKRK